MSKNHLGQRFHWKWRDQYKWSDLIIEIIGTAQAGYNLIVRQVLTSSFSYDKIGYIMNNMSIQDGDCETWVYLRGQDRIIL